MPRPLHAVTALLTLSLLASCYSRRGTADPTLSFSCNSFRITNQEIVLKPGTLYPLGDATLWIPEGTDVEEVRVTVRRGKRKDAWLNRSGAVSFEVAGGATVGFDPPVRVAMYYGNCPHPDRARRVFRVYPDEQEITTAVNHPDSRIVSFTLTGMSEYAMANP